MSQLVWRSLKTAKTDPVCIICKIHNNAIVVKRSYSTSEQRKVFMGKIATELNLKNMDDWYNVTKNDIFNLGGGKLIAEYGSSSRLISSSFPNREWLPWKFKDSVNYWEDPTHIHQYMQWLFRHKKFTQTSDWYQIQAKDFEDTGAYSLIHLFNGSPSQLLSFAFPNENWLPWKFSKSPKIWSNPEIHRKFLENLAKINNFKSEEDFYSITQKEIISAGGATLLKIYNYSPISVITASYPNLLPWKFQYLPKNFWESEKNLRKFLEWVSKELQIKEFSDWYKYSLQSLKSYGGGGIKSTLYDVLSRVYPEFPWEPWRFSKVQSWEKVFREPELKKKYVDYVKEEVGNDWKSITYQNIEKIKKPMGWGVQQLYELVHNGSDLKSDRSGLSKKTQSTLKSSLKQIFPHNDILEEYKHPELKSPTGFQLEFDFYFPQLKLAVELHGRQHFVSVKYLENKTSLQYRMHQDIFKENSCKSLGISLVKIPYWWDRKVLSLEATLYATRPDLFDSPVIGDKIPLSEPEITVNKASTDEKSARKKIMTATEWEEGKDPTGWWLSEKFDGMRLFWDGSNFFTRQGRKISVPEEISSKMPKFALDGEIWTKYGLYQEAVHLSKISTMERWASATFWVFDAPNIYGGYEERVKFLKEQQFPEFVKVVEIKQCKGMEDLKQNFDSVIKKGGEGIMLREPGSMYVGGRSKSLCKYKEFFDTEVKVVENKYPHGLECVQHNGRRIFVSIVDNMLEAKSLEKGAIVTVKYKGTNVHGTLQNPKFYRERKDVDWEAPEL